MNKVVKLEMSPISPPLKTVTPESKSFVTRQFVFELSCTVRNLVQSSVWTLGSIPVPQWAPVRQGSSASLCWLPVHSLGTCLLRANRKTIKYCHMIDGSVSLFHRDPSRKTALPRKRLLKVPDYKQCLCYSDCHHLHCSAELFNKNKRSNNSLVFFLINIH